MNNISIYVLPSVKNSPPRAILMDADTAPDPVIEPGETVQMRGMLVTWQADTGQWVDQSGLGIPPQLSEAITEHAKSLGVPGW